MSVKMRPEAVFTEISGPASRVASGGLSRRTVLSFALAAPVVAACDTLGPGVEFPEMSFTHLPRIDLNVGKVDIVNQHRMTFKPPNIEHAAPVAPGSAAERWARDVLNPVGGAGTLTFTILNAAITEKRLEKEEGLRDLLTDNQSDQYTATLHVRADIVTAARRAGAEVKVTLSQTVAESAALNTRARAWYDMTTRLMQKFDTGMRSEIDIFFGDFTR